MPRTYTLTETCSKGHEWTPENTITYHDGRRCRSCKLDAERKRRHGLVEPKPDRFWSKVDKTNECWNWTAALDDDGYGNFRKGRAVCVKAHRESWELLCGPIPEGLTIDHLCRNRRCVNPDHMEPVTQAENYQRGLAFRRALADEYDPEGNHDD